MKKKIKTLISKYITAESNLIKELNNLPNGMEECNCRNHNEEIHTIHTGEWLEIVCRCTKCGGFKE